MQQLVFARETQSREIVDTRAIKLRFASLMAMSGSTQTAFCPHDLVACYPTKPYHGLSITLPSIIIIGLYFPDCLLMTV